MAADVTRPKQPLWQRYLRWGVTLAIVLPVLWSAAALDVTATRILRAPGLIWTIVSAMFPVTEMGSADYWSSVPASMGDVLDSVYIAWIGTLIGAFFSFFLAFPAARNLTPRWISAGTRLVLSTIRAFPEILLAVLFIPIVGLGPFAGVLAVGIHSIGTLGKLSSEVIEGIERGPQEAIRATGGSRWNGVRWGVAPQVMPEIVAYWLYRFEINIRASAVLGIVGAGGIGDRLQATLRFRRFDEAGIVLLLTIVTVMLVDAVSARIRRRIIAGSDATSGPEGVPVPVPVAL